MCAGEPGGGLTEAVGSVGHKHLAGRGDLELGAQHGLDNQVLHLAHQHWGRHRVGSNSQWGPLAMLNMVPSTVYKDHPPTAC